MSENPSKLTSAEKISENVKMKNELSEFDELLANYKSRFDTRLPRNQWSQYQLQAWSFGNAQAEVLWWKYGGEYGSMTYPKEFMTESNQKFSNSGCSFFVLILVGDTLFNLVPRVMDPESSRPSLTCYEDEPVRDQKTIQCIRNIYTTDNFKPEEIQKITGDPNNIVNIIVSKDGKKAVLSIPRFINKSIVEDKILEQIIPRSSF
jgi:hypothetical protein